MNRDTKAEI